MFNTRIITKYLQKMYIDKSFNQLKTIRQYQVNYQLEQFFFLFFFWSKFADSLLRILIYINEYLPHIYY